MSRTYGFLLEFIPMEIGAGMTFLEIALRKRPRDDSLGPSRIIHTA